MKPLNPELSRNSEVFFKERSRLSHHIAKLERMGAVRKPSSSGTA